MKSAVKKTISFIIVIMMMTLLLAGCGSSGQASKEQTAAIDSAQDKVIEFSRNQRRNGAIFNHSIMEIADDAARRIGRDYSAENIKKVAEDMDLDSITVADENKDIVGSYPDDLVGKKLKDIEELKMFSSIASNNAIQMITEPVYDEESGKYRFLAGVHRADGTGVVVVELRTDDYASVCGEDLAQQCGDNIIIIKDDAVVSSTVEGVEARDTLEDLGISADDLAKGVFTITADGKDYKCASAQAGDYYIVSAA